MLMSYRNIYIPTDDRRSVGEHVLVAEKALGRKLPKGACVHHVDQNRRNNINSNLVICQNSAYHNLLHVRLKVLRSGGNPNTDKLCSGCGQAKSILSFAPNKSKGDGLRDICRECRSSKNKKLYAARKGRH